MDARRHAGRGSAAAGPRPLGRAESCVTEGVDVGCVGTEAAEEAEVAEAGVR